jgi:hypothetical protein
VSAFLNAPPTPEPVVVLAAQTAYTPLKVGCVRTLCVSENSVFFARCTALLHVQHPQEVFAQRQQLASFLLPLQIEYHHKHGDGHHAHHHSWLGCLKYAMKVRAATAVWCCSACPALMQIPWQ